ncbi:hypothetical protein H4R27_005609, partial [Coemansia aciculifera]
NGAWNIRDKRVMKPGETLGYWAVLVLANRQHVNDNAVQRFVTTLVDACKNTGYAIKDPQPPIVYGNPHADIAREMMQACKSIRLKPNTAPQLLLVILPSTNTQVYQTVKNCAYTTLGVHTQCMQPKHALRPNLQYCANLCLKINAKLGVGFEEATSLSSGHYGGVGTTIGGRPAAPGSVAAKIIKINNHLDESMYFM